MVFAVALIAILLALRVIWQLKTNLFTCVVFWLMVSILWTLSLLFTEIVISDIFVMAGLGMNCLVTISNGGYMPCANNSMSRSTFSVWAKTSEMKNPKFAFLGDNYNLFIGYFSMGDILILTGFVINIINSMAV